MVMTICLVVLILTVQNMTSTTLVGKIAWPTASLMGLLLIFFMTKKRASVTSPPPFTNEQRLAAMAEIGRMDFSKLRGAVCPHCKKESTAFFGGVCLQCSGHPLGGNRLAREAPAKFCPICGQELNPHDGSCVQGCGCFK